MVDTDRESCSSALDGAGVADSPQDLVERGSV
jgi:hypothetical protein